MSSVDSKQLSELINSCKKGDRNAQRVIYDKYYPLFIMKKITYIIVGRDYIASKINYSNIALCLKVSLLELSKKNPLYAALLK